MSHKLFKLFSLAVIFLFLFSPFVFSQERAEEAEEEEKITIYFFEDRWCRVCRDVKQFIEKIEDDYEQMDVIIYPISDRDLLDKIGEMHGVESPDMMAPTIFINSNNRDYYIQFIQFSEEEKEELIAAIEGEDTERDCCLFTIPLIGLKIDISEWSLLFITIALGAIDGFNICSLGALILILSIVIAFESRRKIFFYGGLFIFITVAVYGLIVFAWRGLYEVLAVHIESLGFVIGGLAFLGGVYFLKEAWRFLKHGPTCESSQNRLVINATKKLQEAFSNPKRGTIALAGSVILFGVIITLVELPCSIGIPLVYTGFLADAGISLTASVLYILLYLFFYMLIEAVVFTGAVMTKKIWLVDSKAMIWVTLFGAIILFYLAFYYIF